MAYDNFIQSRVQVDPTDTDLFIINAKPYRDCIGNTDFVMTNFDSIEEVLLRFDLPVCRVAYNPDGIWISAHCIAAIVTGQQYVSEQAATKEELDDIQLVYLFEQFSKRVEKYKHRGVETIFIPVKKTPLWMEYEMRYAQRGMRKGK